jgi:coenzyme F420-dependent glucose-6-phosphate dehydrogenase
MALEIHYNVYGCFRDPGSDIKLAKEAINAGFEGIWIGDHFLPWIDSRPYSHHVLPWFGSLMNEIPDVPVGTSVTCPMLRYRPPLLAQAIATLDNMYPGRFNLGVGVGEALNEAHFVDTYPAWDERAEKMIEALELMDRLWNSDRYIRHNGKYFDYEHLKLYTPPKEHIPIHWAGWGPKSCRYAAKHADHLITAAPADTIADRIIPNYERGLEEAGRSISDVDITTEVAINLGNSEELITRIRERGEYIPADRERYNPDPRSIQRVATNELATMTDEEIAEINTITDDPNHIIEELHRLEDAGVTRVLIGSNVGNPMETIQAFESEVFPSFS